MRLARIRDEQGPARAAAADDGGLRPLTTEAGAPLAFEEALALAPDALRARIEAARGVPPLDPATTTVLAPIERHEVWGAGVTYLRSKQAREEESERAATFYDQVYEADRPELFFKATPSRVVGPDEPIRVRADSTWSVPEPELGLLLAPDLRLVGFVLGNDVSARDIEGRNPLYLPQAKVYDACCALGPHILLAGALPPREQVEIALVIERGGQAIFHSATTLDRMRRRFDELVGWLGRDNVFPDGVVLLTGTGIVPPDDLSLEPGDVVEIRGTGLGTLRNPVVRNG